MSLSGPEMKALASKKRAAERNRVLAYAKVFGNPKRLTAHQRVVMADMEAGCFFRKSTMAVNEDGQVDPLKMAANEGRRSVIVEIKHFMDQAQSG